MLNVQDAKDMYNLAKAMAQGTPDIGGKLSGNCTTVSYGLLAEAKKLDPSATLAIGWIKRNGTTRFRFSDGDYKLWKQGQPLNRYGLHCWITFPALDDILDLTLIATLTEMETVAMAKDLAGYTFLRRQEASAVKVDYFLYSTGDDLLLQLNLSR